MIDIKGLNKAEVLTALFNGSRQQGMGRLDRTGACQLTKPEAEEILKTGSDFDYLRGRVMKVSIGEDSFNPRLYDRDNGGGAAERAIAHLRST